MAPTLWTSIQECTSTNSHLSYWCPQHCLSGIHSTLQRLCTRQHAQLFLPTLRQVCLLPFRLGPHGPYWSHACETLLLSMLHSHVYWWLSSYSLVAFLRHKDAILQHFMAMVSWAETCTGHMLTSVHSDCGAHLWLESLKCSSCPKESHIRHLFLIHPSKMVMQRGSTKLCLKKQKQCAIMPICQNPFGKMLLKPHYIFITNNWCIVMIERCPLNHSMETNWMFLILGFLEHSHKSGFIQIKDKTSCLLNQRRWSL